MNCIIEDCGKERKTRGLCNGHYMIGLRQIKKGNFADWNALEGMGMALPLETKDTELFDRMLGKKLNERFKGTKT